MFGQPSGQFNYQPVDDRTGENIARGISTAADAISRGIQGYRAEKQKKEADDAALFWLKTNGAKFGLNTQDEGELKATIKTAGGGAAAVNMLTALEAHKTQQAQAQVQQQIQQQQLLAAQAAAAARQRDDAALQAATGGNESVAQFAQRGGYIQRSPAPMARSGGGQIDEQAVLAYLQRGGSARGATDLAQVADYLAQAKQRSTPKAKFELEEKTGESGQKYFRQSDGSWGLVPSVKPVPGSMGTVVEDVPGVGSLVRDRATGDLVDGGKITKPVGKEGAKKTEAEVTFETNLEVAQKKLDEFTAVVKQYGNYENPTGNAQAKAKLDQLPYQLAVLTAKVVDPSSVAREGEVAAAQKYLLPAGFFTRNETTLAAIENMRQTFGQYAKAREKAQGAPLPAGAGSAAAASGENFRDADGTSYPIRTIPGKGRGIVKGGKFYPLLSP